MLPEPGVPEDELLLTEAGDGKHDTFAVRLVAEDEIGDFPDASGFVGSAVDIVDRNRSRERADWDVVGGHILGVNELAGRPAIQET